MCKAAPVESRMENNDLRMGRLWDLSCDVRPYENVQNLN